MCSAAQEGLGCLLHRFRKGGVRVDRQSHILGQGSHFNRQSACGDECFGKLFDDVVLPSPHFIDLHFGF